MNELDVMRDMNCCIMRTCKECSRCGQADCSTNLKRDANVIMKMQYDAIKAGADDIVRLQKENEELSKMVRKDYFNGITEEKMVSLVNKIIEESFDQGDNGGNLDVLVCAMQDFLSVLPKSYAIVIQKEAYCPKIYKIVDQTKVCDLV